MEVKGRKGRYPGHSTPINLQSQGSWIWGYTSVIVSESRPTVVLPGDFLSKSIGEASKTSQEQKRQGNDTLPHPEVLTHKSLTQGIFQPNLPTLMLVTTPSFGGRKLTPVNSADPVIPTHLPVPPTKVILTFLSPPILPFAS